MTPQLFKGCFMEKFTRGLLSSIRTLPVPATTDLKCFAGSLMKVIRATRHPGRDDCVMRQAERAFSLQQSVFHPRPSLAKLLAA
jgi:hypothetical protein